MASVAALVAVRGRSHEIIYLTSMFSRRLPLERVRGTVGFDGPDARPGGEAIWIAGMVTRQQNRDQCDLLYI